MAGNNFFSRFLWWQVDLDQLNKQVAEYETLGLWNSVRGASAMLCALTIVLTALVGHFMGVSGATMFWESVIWGALAACMYRGQRWAFIASMVLWSVEKFGSMTGAGGKPGRAPLPQLIWWALYLRYFYLGYRVEKARAEGAPRPTFGGTPPSARPAPTTVPNASAPARALLPTQRACPLCAGAIARQAVFCRHCLKSLPATG